MRKATISDKQLVSEILVSAFSSLKENNSITLVVKQDNKKDKRLNILMGYLFEKAFFFGEIFISDNEKACVLLHYPHLKKTSIKTILMDINLVINCIGLSSIFNVLKRQKLANKNYPNEKHIRPLITGVLKEFKGNGTAARLMLQVKKRLQNNKTPIILDTASLENVKLYQKFGFKIINVEDSLDFKIYFLRLN